MQNASYATGSVPVPQALHDAAASSIGEALEYLEKTVTALEAKLDKFRVPRPPQNEKVQPLSTAEPACSSETTRLRMLASTVRTINARANALLEDLDV